MNSAMCLGYGTSSVLPMQRTKAKSSNFAFERDLGARWREPLGPSTLR